MIRIDEIYQNVFLPKVAQKSYQSIHWFDPFGSVDFRDLCSFPVISSAMPDDPTRANHDVVRYLFWDQEPLHVDTTDIVLQKFNSIFDTGKRHIVVSEFNSEYVNRIQDLYGFHAHYYFFHAWAALDWYRGYNRSLLYRPFKDRVIHHNFLCLNNIIGGERKHRILLLKELIERDLIKNNLISFPSVCPFENLTIQELIQKYNINLDPSAIEFPLIVDRDVPHQNNSHQIDLWKQADQSLLQIVTETVYFGNRNHLTEKSFKPIVMQQPFVLISCRGSLEYLRSYGFRTFSEFWNESYDELDDDKRIQAIGSLLQSLNSLSGKEIRNLQKHLAPLVEHNFRWFYSREFEKLLWQELQHMMLRW